MDTGSETTAHIEEAETVAPIEACPDLEDCCSDCWMEDFVHEDLGNRCCEHAEWYGVDPEVGN